MDMSVCWGPAVILFNIFLLFGYYYSMIIPATLQNEFMNNLHPPVGSNNTSEENDCQMCLGLGEVRYNLLFSVMRWTLAISSLPTGYMIDRLGSSRSAILLSLMALFGNTLFTIGAMSLAPTSVPVYLLMVTGRIIHAIGVIQARVVVHCFPDNSFMPLAFSFFGFGGEGLSYYITPSLAATVGIRFSLWLGVVTCGLSFLCAVGLLLLLKRQKPKQVDGNENEKTELPTLSHILELPKYVWLFILTMASIQGTLISGQVNLTDYLELQYGYTMIEAGYITGVTCLFNMSTPILSILIKYIDCHGFVLTAASIAMTSVYALLGFCLAIHPLILTIAYGIGTSIIEVITWQIIIVISPHSCVGTLGGIFSVTKHLTVAFILLASGYILETPEMTDTIRIRYSYQHFFLMLIIIGSISVVCIVVMNVLDIRNTCALNMRISRWKKSDTESIQLLPIINSSLKN